jgi:hypothetical protein
MCINKITTFLFKCEDCNTILSADFEKQEDIDNINENKVELTCPCEGRCKVLRN